MLGWVHTYPLSFVALDAAASINELLSARDANKVCETLCSTRTGENAQFRLGQGNLRPGACQIISSIHACVWGCQRTGSANRGGVWGESHGRNA